MRQLNYDWGLFWLLMLEFIGLEKIIIIIRITNAWMVVCVSSKNYNFLEWTVRISLPESLKLLMLSFRGHYAKGLWYWGIFGLVLAKLHIQKYLRKVKMDFINIFPETSKLIVLIFSCQLVNGVKNDSFGASLSARGLVSTSLDLLALCHMLILADY